MPDTLASNLAARTKIAIPMLAVVIFGLTVPRLWVTLAVCAALICTSEIMTEYNKANVTMKAKTRTLTVLISTLTGLALMSWLRFEKDGIWVVLLIGLSVIIADTGALIVGKWYKESGRKTTQLAPSISENKTRQGAVGGGIMGFLAAKVVMGFASVHDPSYSEGVFWLLCLTTPLLAIAGDLLESKAKRLLDIKDFGNLLGPHGGLTDRLDAMTFVFATNSLVYVPYLLVV